MTMRAPLVGDALPELMIEGVGSSDILAVALLLRDANPIHFDPVAIRSAGFDRAVNQGGSTMAYILTMLSSWAGGSGAITTVSCRFRGQVFAGDDVRVGGVVTAAVHADDGSTTVECDVWADVVGGARAIAGTARLQLREQQP